MPSAAPPPSESTSSLRKPRGNTNNSGRASPNPISRSNTPISNASSVGGQANPYASEQSGIASQKAANENYFASLGQANANRSADLHPSQGGKYTGFGSSPMPSPGNGGSSSAFHPSSTTSSRALPTLNDIQADPLKAIGKGWGLFSNTLSQATKSINETVIQPSLTKINDPNLQSSLHGYYAKGGEFISYGLQQSQAVLGEGIKTGGDWAKSRGLDTSYLDRLGPGGANGFEQNGGAMGYNSLSQQGDGPVPHQTSLESQEAGYADLDTPPVSRAKTVNQTYPSYGSTSSTGNNAAQTTEEDFFVSHLKQSSQNSGRSTPSTQPPSVEDGLKNMSIGSTGSSGSGSVSIKRPVGRKGLGAVRSATPPIAAKKKNGDDDEWAKFD